MSKPLKSRKDTAQFLTDQGFKTAEASLATHASRGNGPPYYRYGPFALYDEDEVLAWARARLKKPVRCTGHLHAA